MNHDDRIDTPAGASTDKFELHYRQQLSALVDGELPTDEARFLLRRLQHDDELAACQERWQLLGDVLRGNACAPAPADFGQRVQQAIAADAVLAPASQAARQPRSGWLRWSGGAALAASVAALALFTTRQQVPAELPAAAPAVIATTAQLSLPAGEAEAEAPALAVRPAAAPMLADVSPRPPARRAEAAPAPATQLATPARAAEAMPALAAQAPAAATAADPFAGAGVLQARPWPRSALAPALSHSTLSASLQQGDAATTFYPFEPQMPASEAVEAQPQVPQR